MLEEPSESGSALFVAETLLARVGALAQEREGVRRAEDIEYIHRMRVASRRLRTALELFTPFLPAKKAEGWRQAVRRITRALGAARDADVQIECVEALLAADAEARDRPGLQRLLLRLRQQRAVLQRRVARALDRLADDRLIEEMEAHLRTVHAHAQLLAAVPASSALLRLAGGAITGRLAELLGFEIYVRQPERVAELHAMRIAAKRLRYTLELFAPLFPGELKAPIKTAKGVQELLGDIHDCDVWLTRLPQVLAEERALAIAYQGHARGVARLAPGLRALEADRRALRDARYREFQAAWPETATVWRELVGMVNGE